MNIAVDIDDTLTDTFDYLIPYAAEYFGGTAEELRTRNISYSNLPEEWKDRELDFCKTYYDRVIEDTPFKPDAAWGIDRLRELGHRIVIITGRNSSFYTDPYKTTAAELKKGGIRYDKLICTLDKGNACAAEGIDLLIDDLPAHCAAAAERGILPILFTSPANRGEEHPFHRVSNWVEAVEAVTRLTTE